MLVVGPPIVLDVVQTLHFPTTGQRTQHASHITTFNCNADFDSESPIIQ